MGYEKVLLYGLPLIEKRRISYSTVDPKVAREMFIREAMVLMQLTTRAPFFAANCALIRKITDLEERTRRRDLLVDENRIAQFYEERLPPGVVDVASLERWYFSLPKEKAAELLLSEAQLQTTVLDAQALAQFPERVAIPAMALDLNYLFDPGKENDGVSVTVPVSVLKQLREAELDWLVPGLLREKCIALIRALPKPLRRNFVPVPDHVDRLLPDLKQQDGSLQQALTRQLLRHSGVQLPPECWDGVVLPDHLQIFLKVVDEKGQLLGSGRDLAQLKLALGGAVQASISKAAGNSIEQRGLTEWSFGDLPLEYELGDGKLRLKSYPALIDKGESVDLTLLDSAYKARLASIAGVTRLFMLNNRQQLRYLHKELLQKPQQLHAVQMLGQREQVLDWLIQRVYSIAFAVEEALPRTQSEFSERLASKSKSVLAVAMQVEEILYQILVAWHELRKRLLHRPYGGPQALPLQQDVNNQLAMLFPDRFLLTTPWLHLQQLPRYLKAIEMRLDKYPQQPAKDLAWTRLLEGLWQQYLQRRQYCERHEIEEEALDQYRWLLEELRISLFAQTLGTRIPVSEKRLHKFWQEQVLGKPT